MSFCLRITYNDKLLIYLHALITLANEGLLVIILMLTTHLVTIVIYTFMGHSAKSDIFTKT